MTAGILVIVAIALVVAATAVLAGVVVTRRARSRSYIFRRRPHRRGRIGRVT